MDNPIVDEVHYIREQMLAEYGGDMHALIEDIRRDTEEATRAGRKIYSPPQLKFRSSESATKESK